MRGETVAYLSLVTRVSTNHSSLRPCLTDNSIVACRSRRFYAEISPLNAIECLTTHSLAFTCWKNHAHTCLKTGLLTKEEDVERIITDRLSEDIAKFLLPMQRNRKNSASFLNSTYKMVVFYIRKQFVTQFVHLCDEEDACFAHTKGFGNRTYYPATKWHEKHKDSVPPCHFFYVDSAKKLWSFLDLSKNDGKRFTYDSVLRNVQLQQLPISCSALLVDECQDLTKCQVDWFIQQASLYKKQVFFVGDVNQSIYGFRGAKSTNITKLEPRHLERVTLIDRKLTISFRFDSQIASAANTLLFYKWKSPQPDPGYRVTGCGQGPGVVMRQPLTLEEHGKITVLAFANVSLFCYAVEFLTDFYVDRQNMSKITTKTTTTTTNSTKMTTAATTGATTASLALGLDLDAFFPFKFAFLGKGEGSGSSRWKMTLKQIGDFYDLFNNSVNPAYFMNKYPEFQDQEISWNKVVSTIDARELSKYNPHVFLVQKYGKDTPQVVEKFRKKILEKSVSEKEADVILGTVHAAKGCEWDNVMLLDDCEELLQVNKKSEEGGSKWEFNFKPYGDDLNVWYVGLTRAKKVLSVPPKFCRLYDFLNNLPNFNKPEKEDNDRQNKIEKKKEIPTDVKSLSALNKELAEPWRAECKELNGGFVLEGKSSGSVKHHDDNTYGEGKSSSVGASDKGEDDDSYGGMQLLEEVLESQSQSSSNFLSPFAQSYGSLSS